ncbi:MAG: TonB-dependent receptor [Hyellaceae cyanobacterium CSU_1_1]|nr:TonB-dependent receptor [Hyellaceae cyanobacterium CSU_1_1]
MRLCKIFFSGTWFCNVNNLFDEEYITTAFVGAAPDPLAAYGDRRTFGVQVKTKF